jgi:hypothetical protein
MPLPTPSLPARHFDPAPRELVGTVYPWAVPAFFDDAELSGDLPSFQSVCSCQPNADHAAFAGVFAPFHEPMTSAEAQPYHVAR